MNLKIQIRWDGRSTTSTLGGTENNPPLQVVRQRQLLSLSPILGDVSEDVPEDVPKQFCSNCPAWFSVLYFMSSKMIQVDTLKRWKQTSFLSTPPHWPGGWTGLWDGATLTSTISRTIKIRSTSTIPSSPSTYNRSVQSQWSFRFSLFCDYKHPFPPLLGLDQSHRPTFPS